MNATTGKTTVTYKNPEIRQYCLFVANVSNYGEYREPISQLYIYIFYFSGTEIIFTQGKYIMSSNITISTVNSWSTSSTGANVSYYSNSNSFIITFYSQQYSPSAPAYGYGILEKLN